MYSSASSRKEIQLNGEFVVNNPPADTISAMAYAPNSNILVACSWDGSIYIYECNGSYDSTVLKTSIPNPGESPILCCCFSPDGLNLFTGSADGKIRVLNMMNTQLVEIGTHTAGIGCIICTNNGILVTGGWDKKLKFWQVSSMINLVKEYTLADKIYAIDSQADIVSVCIVGNIVLHYNTFSLEKIILPEYSGRDTYSMRYGTGSTYGATPRYKPSTNWAIRSIACSLSGDALAVGGIDGRAEVLNTKTQQQSSMNSTPTIAPFKCSGSTTGNILYSVNKIMFHPVFPGILLTCTSNGKFCLWKMKEKILLASGGPSNEHMITTAAFHPSGKYLAIAIGYDWSKGFKSQIDVPVEILIYPIPENIMA
ncbi:mRNA export factor [Nematocida sp. AWRm80]|nr:mRNA export factor [Nematocida sp. AWRm80]